jgi:hypothetical protein
MAIHPYHVGSVGRRIGSVIRPPDTPGAPPGPRGTEGALNPFGRFALKSRTFEHFAADAVERQLKRFSPKDFL